MQHLLIGFFIALTSISAYAQERTSYKFPKGAINVVVMQDPDCPIQILEPFNVTGRPTGAISLDYTIRNVSLREIESFEIEEVNWAGSLGKLFRVEMLQGRTLGPNKEMSALDDREKSMLGDYSAELAKEYGINPTLNRFWIVTVVKVRYSDGTTYDGTSRFKRLTEFIDALKVDKNLSPEQVLSTETRLKTFLVEMKESNRFP